MIVKLIIIRMKKKKSVINVVKIVKHAQKEVLMVIIIV